MAPTVQEVENLSSKQWEVLDDQQKQQLLDMAEREVQGLYGGRVATIDETEGNEDDLITLVAAHKWTLAEGGEAQSESSAGGNINYNVTTGETPNGWTETKWGRQAIEYIRRNQQIGFVRTW